MEIRNYIALDFDQFIKLVDLFGGFQITMDEPLLDPKLGTIPAGNVFLNGSNALILARSRNYPNGDLERVRQQQRIITQILYKGKDMAGLPGAAWFLRAGMDFVETNLTLDDVISLCREFASFPVVDVQGGVAPGKLGMVGSASVYLLDQAGLGRMIQSVQTSSEIPEEFR
jgi:anionic cell wall polymer biosynthesis LytR-Cps2A-Psr (LCP) family protein